MSVYGMLRGSDGKKSEDDALRDVIEEIKRNPSSLNKIVLVAAVKAALFGVDAAAALFGYYSGGSGGSGTLLHFSCIWNKPKVVSFLLSQQDVDVTKKFESSGYNGLTAKQIAEKDGRSDIVALFEQYERKQAKKEPSAEIININKIVDQEMKAAAEKESAKAAAEKAAAKKAAVEKAAAEKAAAEKAAAAAEKAAAEKAAAEKAREVQNEVRSWILEKSLPRDYAQLFIENGYDSLENLCLIEEDDFKTWGVNIPAGHKKKIMIELNKLKSSTNEATQGQQNLLSIQEQLQELRSQQQQQNLSIYEQLQQNLLSIQEQLQELRSQQLQQNLLSIQEQLQELRSQQQQQNLSIQEQLKQNILRIQEQVQEIVNEQHKINQNLFQ